jgi:hypothetical protein
MLTSDLETEHDIFLAKIHGQRPSVTVKTSGEAHDPTPELPPINPESDGGDGESRSPVKVKEDELWSHLSKILDLQSEIAHLHVEMEGVGAKNNEGRRHGKRRADQEWDARDEDAEDADADEVRDEEFAALADRFTGRRAAIDGIMGKVSFTSIYYDFIHGDIGISWTSCPKP